MADPLRSRKSLKELPPEAGRPRSPFSQGGLDTDHGDPHLPGSKLLGTPRKPSIIRRIRRQPGGPGARGGGAEEHDIPGIWGSAREGRNRSHAALSTSPGHTRQQPERRPGFRAVRAARGCRSCLAPAGVRRNSSSLSPPYPSTPPSPSIPSPPGLPSALPASGIAQPPPSLDTQFTRRGNPCCALPTGT